MKKTFVISKLINEHAGFFFLKETTSHTLWTADIAGASQYSKEAEAELALASLPENTLGNFFRIEPVFIKAKNEILKNKP